MLCDVATAWWRKLTPDYFLVGGVSLQGGIAEHHAGVHANTTEGGRHSCQGSAPALRRSL